MDNSDFKKDAVLKVEAEQKGQGEACELAKKKERTTGLKLFDFFLYPVLTNGVVFAVSVAATYLTSHGDKAGGDIGKFFFERGNVFKKYATKLGMGEKQADAAKMVAFSFIDGSVMAPAVKLLEDEREDIAKKIDEKLGTKPEDESVYEAEPKQSWKSVFSGRAAALAVVLPTAITLGKVGRKDGNWILNKVKNNPGFESLNDIIFYNPGEKLGKYIESKPKIAKHLGSIEIPELMRVGIFEAVYTSLCTGVLYVSSRFFADHWGKDKQPEPPPILPTTSLEKLTDFSAEEKLEKKKFVDAVKNNKNTESELAFSY